MRKLDILVEFVRDALRCGRSRAEIAEALTSAGWAARDVARALSAFSEKPFDPPIPRPLSYVTAYETFVLAALFSAMVVTSTGLVLLIHALIDLWLLDPVLAAAERDVAVSDARWQIAKLVVSAPLFAWLTVRTERDISQGVMARASPVRKWSIYLALFISGLILLGTAAYTIHSLLMGETNLSFVLKAGSVAAVSAAVFLFYLREARSNSDVA